MILLRKIMPILLHFNIYPSFFQNLIGKFNGLSYILIQVGYLNEINVQYFFSIEMFIALYNDLNEINEYFFSIEETIMI